MLEHILVHDAMHGGILGCPAGAPLTDVAAIMSAHHVHAVAVTDGTRVTGVVSDLDVMEAIANGGASCALQAATAEPLGVSGEERVDHAARVMAERGVSHLIVFDAAGGYPVGIISALDIAAVYAATKQ